MKKPMKHNTTDLVLRSLRAKKAFTLVELMVTVTIIATVSVVMISPFKMLIDGMDTRDRSNHIADMIRSLDESVENNKAASYEAVFTTGSMGFVTNQDWYGQRNRVSLDYNFVSHSGVLRKVNAFTGAWTYGMVNLDENKTSSDEQFVGSGASQVDISLPQNGLSSNYKITNTLDNAPIESFLIRYYYLPEDTDVAENPTRLVSITSRTGSGYTALKIRNVHGARTILGYTGTITDTVKPDNLKWVKLVFEKDGTEMVTIIGEMR